MAVWSRSQPAPAAARSADPPAAVNSHRGRPAGDEAAGQLQHPPAHPPPLGGAAHGEVAELGGGAGVEQQQDTTAVGGPEGAAARVPEPAPVGLLAAVGLVVGPPRVPPDLQEGLEVVARQGQQPRRPRPGARGPPVGLVLDVAVPEPGQVAGQPRPRRRRGEHMGVVAPGGPEGGRRPGGVVGQPHPEGVVVDEQRVDRAGHDLARRELDHAAAADDGQVEVVLLAGMHEPEAHAGQPTGTWTVRCGPGRAPGYHPSMSDGAMTEAALSQGERRRPRAHPSPRRPRDRARPGRAAPVRARGHPPGPARPGLRALRHPLGGDRRGHRVRPAVVRLRGRDVRRPPPAHRQDVPGGRRGARPPAGDADPPVRDVGPAPSRSRRRGRGRTTSRPSASGRRSSRPRR